MSLDNIVHSFDSDRYFQHAGNGRPAEKIFGYLTDQNAKTIIIEKGYIDKHYLIDFQKFYSRAHKSPGKDTTRIHFFEKDFTKKDFESELNKEESKDLQDSYLGFIIVKPIVSKCGEPVIGRTLLKTYPSTSGSKMRKYIKKRFDVSLFGIKLFVDSIPFQEQDFGVSACATIALWTALQALSSSFDVSNYSPSEITEMAAECPSPFRVFPQIEGLTLPQVLTCIRYAGLDVEYIIPDGNDDIINTAVKAYVDGGIPIIATLEFSANEHHAVVITGYQTNENGKITEYYVHDDQIGPYARVEPNPNFLFWKNEWSEEDGYTVELGELIVPIYHKIRLLFYHIYEHYEYRRNNLPPNWEVKLYLTSV